VAHSDEQRAVLEYYALGLEQARLDSGSGLLEFERTKEIIGRHLPRQPAVVADIGGGPGRYALWLAELGHAVRHRDVVPLHVEQLSLVAGGRDIETAVGDATELDLADSSVDAVLLLGPLYHLQRRPDRLRALREAKRIVRPGGPVFVVAIRVGQLICTVCSLSGCTGTCPTSSTSSTTSNVAACYARCSQGRSPGTRIGHASSLARSGQPN
jgi:ubiquinone/menaquinone biosynthesis C-methylase UbiE